MKGWKYVLLLLPFLVSVAAIGQNATFHASVDKNPVGLNETFQLTFTLENGDGGNFKPPSFNDFNVLGGPNQSSSFVMNNGSTSRSTSFSYYLQPRSVGKFTIGSATVESNGRAYVSEKTPIEVVKGNAPANSNNNNRGSGNNSKVSPNMQEQIKDNLFVKVTVDRSEVYQGEQVTATYKLYTRTQIGNTNLTKEPSFTGFWKQELEAPQQLSMQTEVLNGVRYNVALIKKIALFPQRSGDLEIEPMGLTSVVRVQKQRSGNVFDDFFGSYQDVKYDYESNRLKIKVKPLPTANKPADFSGFTGDLGMEVVLDKKETKTDDPITVSVRFTGKGNLKVLEAPKLDLPNDFDIFDPKMVEKMNKGNNVVSGTRNYDYLVIPRRPGTFKLPSFSVSYFDPAAGKYKTLESGDFNITVTGQPSKSSGTGNITGVSKEEVQLLGQDIRYIKNTTGGLHKKQGFFFGSCIFDGLYGAPFLLFILLLFYRRRKEQQESDTVQVRSRGATRAAVKRLKAARSLLDNNDRKGFYDELSRALWGYLGDKLNIDLSVLNHETAMNALLARNVPEDLVAQTFRIIGDCEIALYAPTALVGTMDSLYDEAKELIGRLEEELGKK